ncbi:hypothetical protein MTO96_048912 [Rhipicephalus appendiculatus]
MFVVCFSISFVFYVDAVSVLQYKEFWIPGFTVVITLLAYVAMHYLITGVALVTVLSACFVLVGCIQCALSIAAAAMLGKITESLVVLSKGVSNVLVIHCLTYVMELFPSALRAGVGCWSFACGRVAAICAVLILVLEPAGYEDVVFAMTALFLFASLFMIRDLPKTTVVEEAKIVARDPTDSSRMTMDHMKRTLESKMLRRRSRAPSLESARSSKKRRYKSTGSSKKRMLFLILLESFTTRCQTPVASLVTGDVDHWCKPPGGFNISDWKNIAIPMEADGRFSRCRVYKPCKPLAEHGTFVDRHDVNSVAPAAVSW